MDHYSSQPITTKRGKGFYSDFQNHLSSYLKYFEFRLNLHLDKANDLPQRGRKKTYDTIIRINLIPKFYENNSKNSFTSKDVISVQSSRKVKNTLSPHFHEDFIFDVEKFDSLKNLVLRLSLYDYERQGRFDAIGHIVVPLTCLTKPGESKKHNLPFKCQPTVRHPHNLI